MNERKNQPQTLLIHVAEEDIREQEIDLWPGLSQILVASQISKKQRGSSMISQPIRTRKWLVLTGLTMLVLLVLFGLTTSGQTFAQQVLHFFRPAPQTTYPVPSPALTAQALPEEQRPTQPPTPTTIAAAACPQTGEAEKYACDLAFAEKEIGFKIQALPLGFGGLDYRGLDLDRKRKIVHLYYGPEPYGALWIAQGVGDFPKGISSDNDHWGEVPIDAIQNVMVNGQPGEYVEGGFVQTPGSDQYTWMPDLPMARLRWKQGDIWFQISRGGTPESLTNTLGSREAIMKLAESLK